MVPEDAWSSSEGYYHKREGLIRLFDYAMGQVAEFGLQAEFHEGVGSHGCNGVAPNEVPFV